MECGDEASERASLGLSAKSHEERNEGRRQQPVKPSCLPPSGSRGWGLLALVTLHLI